MSDLLAPIIVFVYARPNHTKNTIESLANNILAKDSDIFIFSDASKSNKDRENVNEVREYIDSIPQKKYFKSIKIFKSDKNKGLANSVIEGVTKIINEYGNVIVLEDDLIVDKHFIQYMNNCLDFYKDNFKIWSISGYNLPISVPTIYQHDIYISYRACSWGWATWKDRWNTVDWKVSDYNKFKNNYIKRKKFNRGGNDLSQMLDEQMRGLIDSWAIRWCYEQSKQNKYTIYPISTFVVNKGLDGTGTHSGVTDSFDVRLDNNRKNYKLENVNMNSDITKNFKRKFSYGVKQKIKELLIIIGFDNQIFNYEKKKKANFYKK